MKKYTYTLKAVFLSILLGMTSTSQADSSLTVRHLVNEQNIVSLNVTAKFLILPVQDDAPESKVCIEIVEKAFQIGPAVHFFNPS